MAPELFEEGNLADLLPERYDQARSDDKGRSDACRRCLGSPKKPEILYAFLTELEMSEDEFDASVRDWTTINRFRE